MNEELKIIISAEIDNLKKNTKEAQEQVKETADKGESGFKKFGEAAKKAGKVVAENGVFYMIDKANKTVHIPNENLSKLGYKMGINYSTEKMYS